MKKRKFDVIVIGGGSGLNISSSAASNGLKVAVIEKGPMGGTCLNRGCIPSKILIHHADIMDIISNADKFHIKVGKPKVDFAAIVKETSSMVDKDARNIEMGNKEDKNITLYKGVGRFVDVKTIKVKNEIITGNKIFIVAGTRPTIPPIKGLDKVNYLTSKEALRLSKQPKSITFIGGGYIGVELAHFFGGLGSKVNVINRSNPLVNREDGEIAEKFTEIFSKKYNVFLEYNILDVKKKGKKIVVRIEKNKKIKNIESDELVIATGRVPNSDLLDAKKGGLKVDKRGYIVTNDYLETNVNGVWALGDIAGKYFFKHSANLEAQYAYNNAFKEKFKVDYSAMPHAIFSSPQVAGVGYTEEELKVKKIPYYVGKYDFINTGMGAALKDKDGFVKFLIHKKTRKILGCHILGSEASNLIHEVIVAMKSGNGTIDNITRAVHIHPALNEVVQRAAFGAN